MRCRGEAIGERAQCCCAVYGCGRFRTQHSPQARGTPTGCVRGRGRSDLCANECEIVAERSEDRLGFLSLLVVSARAQEAYLDRLDHHGGGLLDRIHETCNDRRAVFLAGVSRDVWKCITSRVEADRGADDEGDAL